MASWKKTRDADLRPKKSLSTTGQAVTATMRRRDGPQRAATKRACHSVLHQPLLDMSPLSCPSSSPPVRLVPSAVDNDWQKSEATPHNRSRSKLSGNTPAMFQALPFRYIEQSEKRKPRHGVSSSPCPAQSYQVPSHFNTGGRCP